MEILCAECGCQVDRGVRISTCSDPDCCCRDLPMRASECYCCGEVKPTTALGCHPEVAVCRGCATWLASSAGAITALPIFGAGNMDATVAFYEAAGFDVERVDEGYAIVGRGDSEVLHLAGPDSTVNPARSACFIHTTETDTWHAEWSALGLPVSTLMEQPWGLLEFSATDPAGNVVRVGRSPS